MKNCITNTLVTTALYLLAPTVGNANSTVPATDAVLVIDRVDNLTNVTVKQFRITDLKASASGQFSAVELNKIFSLIPAPKQNVWIIDLRQESHGFINGTPVTTYVNQNRLNANKSSAQIMQEEQSLLTGIAKQPNVKLYTLKKLSGGEVSVGEEVTIVPHKVQSEQQLVTSMHAKYYRLYVLDHHRPEDHEVDSFVNFIKHTVKPDDWLHFHCRGGKGRSSTFIAMYDMLRNAQTDSFISIMQRQADNGNKQLDQFSDAPEKQWKLAPAKDRYEFLQKFYVYVADPDGYVVRDWSSWLNLNKGKK